MEQEKLTQLQERLRVLKQKIEEEKDTENIQGAKTATSENKGTQLEKVYQEIPLVTEDGEKWKKQLGHESILRYMGIIFYSQRNGFHELTDREFDGLSNETKKYLIHFYEKNKKELFGDKFEVYNGKDITFGKNVIDTDRKRIDMSVLLFSQDIYGTRGNGLMGGVGGPELKLTTIEYPPEEVLKNLDEIFSGDHTQFRAELYALGKDGLEKLRDDEINRELNTFSPKNTHEEKVREIRERYAKIIQELEERNKEDKAPQEEKTLKPEKPANYKSLEDDIYEEGGVFKYKTSFGTEIVLGTKEEVVSAIQYAFETETNVRSYILDGSYARLIAEGKVSKEKVIKTIEALGFTVPEEIKNATEPLKENQEESVVDDKKEEEESSKPKVVVSPEHQNLKKWPPDELLDTAIEDVEFEETRIERISEMAGVVQIKLADAINNTSYENKGVKISSLEVENFRSDKRDFPFNFNYTVPNQGTHTVEGTIHVPTGKREKFEVTVNPENINLKKGLLPIPGLTWTQNKLLNAAGDKQLLAKNLQTALQTSINHMLDTYYKNKIVDIQEENSA